jgi:hypothetical protein
MSEATIQIELDNFILENFVNFDEYQNKFYLKKKIQEILPEKSDEEVYDAIDYANVRLKAPRDKAEYISILVKKLKE